MNQYTRYNVSVQILEIPDGNGGRKVLHGKDALMNVSGLGPNKIVCVDADFDLLLPNNKYNQQLTTNQYIINTHYYSLENILACPDYLTGIVEDRCNQHSNVDYRAMLETLSCTIKPLLLLLLASHENHNAHPIQTVYYNLKKFNRSVNTMNPLIHNYMDQVSSVRYICSEGILLQQKQTEVNAISAVVSNIMGADENIYKYMPGHTLYGCILSQLLAGDMKNCNNNRRPSTEDVKRWFYSCHAFQKVDIPKEIYDSLNKILEV